MKNALIVLDSVSRLVWDKADLSNLTSLLPYQFTRAYAPATWTLPSSATMVSGVYPPTHRLNLTSDTWTYTGDTIFQSRDKSYIRSDVPYLRALAPIAQYRMVGHFVYANPLRPQAELRRQEEGTTLYYHSAATHFPYGLGRDSALVQGSTIGWQVRMSEKIYPNRLGEEYREKYRENAQILQEAQVRAIEKVSDSFEPDCVEGHRIVLTADHGENWDYRYAHGHGRSFNLNRDTLHVPLLTNIPPQGELNRITSIKNTYNLLLDLPLDQGRAEAYHYPDGPGGTQAGKKFVMDYNQVTIDEAGWHYYKRYDGKTIDSVSPEGE